jgi:polysaccharide biosynthesis protein PslH
MGDILFLAHRLPYPPDRGDRIRSWHVLKALTKLAPVHVVAMIDDIADRNSLDTVSAIAKSISCTHRTRSRISSGVHALLKDTSASVEAFASPDVRKAAADALREHDIDTIYAFSSQMAQYVPKGFKGRFVMDFVDMDSAKFAAMGFAGRQEAKRLLAWEIATAKRADVSLFVSAAEAALFTDATKLAADVMGNGIDLEHFAPNVVAPVDAPAPLIVFTGQMDYGPNIEAVSYFVRTALPEIQRSLPRATFAIVGRAPTAAVKALAGASVIVTGEVPDTRPWLAAANVVVAPLTIARGIQNKILEAMAMGKACVVSPEAAQGIDAVDGRDFMVANDPIAATVRLLTDATQAATIGAAARQCMARSYSWEAQLAPLAGFVRR